MKTVLAAIDFSPVSRAVLKAATELARALRARVVLINVVQPPSIATDLAPVVGEVLRAGHVVGLFTPENLLEPVVLRTAAERAIRRGTDVFSADLSRQLLRTK